MVGFNTFKAFSPQIGGLDPTGAVTSVQITATVAPATSALVVGNSLSDTPNWATFKSLANFATDAAGESIASVVINYIGDTATEAEVFADGENNAFSVTVTDTGGNSRTFGTTPRTVLYGVDPTVSLSVSSANVDQGLVAGSTLATITLANTTETPTLSGADAGLFQIVGGNLQNIAQMDTLGTFSVNVDIDNSRPGSDTAAFSVTVSAVTGDVTLPAQTVGQYSPITPVDLAAHVPAGSRVMSIDLPEGIEVMAKSLKILGAALNQQASATSNIYVVPLSGDPFWVRMDFTVNAPAGTTWTVSTEAELGAVPAYAANYVGPGGVIEITAGATIADLPGAGDYGRFSGLTSPLIIKSADTNNRATLNTSRPFTLSAASGDVGNLSLVDLDIYSPQVGTWDYGQTFNAQRIIWAGGAVTVKNVAVLRCNFTSDVGRAVDKYIPKSEVSGIDLSRPVENMVVWGNDFKKMFNGIMLSGVDVLIGRNTMSECWGDMVRTSVNSVTGIADYVMLCDNFLSDSVSDGLLRHADLTQMGGIGGGSGYVYSNFEERGTISTDSFLGELPAIDPAFNNTSYVRAGTNQTMGATNSIMYRLETDVAAGDLTAQLPDITTVAEGWQVCVQKYSADTTHKITVQRNGSDTINGLGADYEISGAWKAVRFARNGSNWIIQVYSKGVQPGLYQKNFGLLRLETALFHYCAATAGLFAGKSFEVEPRDVDVDQTTLVHAVYGDIDGDAILDGNDYVGAAKHPAIQLRDLAATAELTVSRSVAPTIAKDAGALATLTIVDCDTGQDGATLSTITDRFVGGGRRGLNRLDTVYAMAHKPGGPLDGTGRGAVLRGLADGGYDFVNQRRRLPTAPNVTVVPVISGDEASGYTIATPAAFSASLTPSYQWLRNGDPIPGETGATYSGDTGAATSEVRVRVIGTGASGVAVVDSNSIAHTASAGLTAYPVVELSGPVAQTDLTYAPGQGITNKHMVIAFKGKPEYLQGALDQVFYADNGGGETAGLRLSNNSIYAKASALFASYNGDLPAPGGDVELFWVVDLNEAGVATGSVMVVNGVTLTADSTNWTGGQVVAPTRLSLFENHTNTGRNLSGDFEYFMFDQPSALPDVTLQTERDKMAASIVDAARVADSWAGTLTGRRPIWLTYGDAATVGGGTNYGTAGNAETVAGTYTDAP